MLTMKKPSNNIEHLRALVETRVFGVCTHLGERLGIPTKHIRLFFVYATFIATFSPIIIYMILAFWMNMKAYLEERSSRIWDW